MTVRASVPSVLPGIGLLVAIGLVGRSVASLVGVHHLVAAIAVGALVANTIGVPAWADPGVETRTRWLEAGIVLVGSQLALDTVIESGPVLVGLIAVTVVFTGSVVELVARRVIGVEEKLGSLLAAGSSVCGVSAIVAVAGSVRARDDQIAYAVATVVAFDAMTVFAYPVVGTVLDLPAKAYGIWAGLSMYSTGPVVAAGFARSDLAGQWATVTKITRNAFIAAVVVGYSLWYASRDGDAADLSARTLWATFPTFLIGFVALAVVANLGLLSAAQLASLDAASDWLFLVAFAGFGLSITVEDLRDAGTGPVAVMGVGLLVVSSVSLAVVCGLFACG